MINMDKSEYSESDFTDKSLAAIAALNGPWVATMLLLPGPVPVVWEGLKCMTTS